MQRHRHVAQVADAFVGQRRRLAQRHVAVQRQRQVQPAAFRVVAVQLDAARVLLLLLLLRPDAETTKPNVSIAARLNNSSLVDQVVRLVRAGLEWVLVA